MADINPTVEQIKLAGLGLKSKIFLSGTAGTGKTTAAIARLEHLLAQGIPAEDVMILVPQRTLAGPYYDFLNSSHNQFYNEPTILTIGGLARRMIDLFWPMISTDAGFASSSIAPTFLTIETAQYFLMQILEPLFNKGYFSGINVERNRLAGQILDNMNKAAAIGFPLEEICIRLRDGSPADSGLWIPFQQAEECALLFREFCLQHNLLDYSLQLNLFIKFLWPNDLFRKYLNHKYHHLIYDNVEEDVPMAHKWVEEWAPALESYLLILDENGGFRTFLGADPISGSSLASICEEKVHFHHQFTSTPKIQVLKNILRENIQLSSKPTPPFDVFEQFDLRQSHFYPEMIDNVCQEVNRLIKEEGEKASEVVILAPFVSDSLLFTIRTRMNNFKIDTYSARPSRTLIREPAIHSLVTFAKLAHPCLELPVTGFEMRQALMCTIPEIDIVRGQICSQALFNEKRIEAGLGLFENLKGDLPERISFVIGEKFEKIRCWVEEYKGDEILPLHGFWSRLFGEVLSQPGFIFFGDFSAAELSARLILSAKQFREMLGGLPNFNEIHCSREYLDTIQQGLIGGQFIDDPIHPDAVLIAPAYTYLMTNRPVKYQFWLDIGSSGWWERLNQPLTHPYVLNRQWQKGTPWQDADEIKANQTTLARLVGGLLDRCNQHLYLHMAGMDDQGREQRNQLLQAFNLLFRRAIRKKADNAV